MDTLLPFETANNIPADIEAVMAMTEVERRELAEHLFNKCLNEEHRFGSYKTETIESMLEVFAWVKPGTTEEQIFDRMSSTFKAKTN